MNGPPPIEVEGRAPHHRDRPSTTTHTSTHQSADRAQDSAQAAETSVATESRQVSWWETNRFIEVLLAQSNNGPLPWAGTPAWCDLADGDPRKLLALAAAGEHFVLRVEVAQTAQAEASRAVSAAADWPKIARETQRRGDFHTARPWMRRKVERC
ncbi:DUF2742 domain-containing protein [Mycobacterium intracellulare]|uniref:DUF2742 domain-containing protein n=1 Tax=Mycobacterium intracellulare TaxID=1767 RepID=UPI00109E70F7|nr:DUF2742 domain-containing protein [Mycobacterium intracellulare]